MTITFRDVERGGIRTAYAASLWVNGVRRGYVQKVRDSPYYYAYVDGRRVASAQTLTDLKADLREALAD